MNDPATCRHQHIDRQIDPAADAALDICQDCQAYRIVTAAAMEAGWIDAADGWRKRGGERL